MQGIIVGCDKAQEWLLPWWWQHYSKLNSYPVAFADFGMTEKAIAWVSERGRYIKLPAAAPLKEVSPERPEFRERTQEKRGAWFKKPLACLYSPFPESLWIDLDCEVRGNLEPLFNILAFGDLAAAKAPIESCRKQIASLLPKYTLYNSGVIPFRRDASVISYWVEETLHRNNDFFGDDEILSWAIHKGGSLCLELSDIYNWHAYLAPNPEAVMIHYAGNCKDEIAKKLGVLKE